MHAQLTGALVQSLTSDSEMSISDYEVLAVLSEVPDGTLRAHDPARWSRTSITARKLFFATRCARRLEIQRALR